MKKFFKEYLLTNRTSEQTILKNTFWLFLSESFAKIISFFIMVFVARSLGADNFGKFSFALSLVLLISIIADFGFNTIIVREIAQNKKNSNKIYSRYLSAKHILAATSMIIIVIIGMVTQRKANDLFLIIILGGYIILNNYTDFFRAIARSHEKMQFDTIIRFFSSTLLFISIIIATKYASTPIYIAVAYFVSTLAGIFLGYHIISKKIHLKAKINFPYNQIYKTLKKSYPFAIMIFAGTIYFSIDIIMLKFFVTDDIIGIYSAAVKIYQATLIPAVILSLAFFPKMSQNKLIKNLRKTIKFNLKINISTAALILLVGYSFGGYIIQLFFGVGYTESITYFKYLILLLPIRYLNFVFGDNLSANNLQKLRTKSIFISAGINILTNIILMPSLFVIGAIIATGITEIALFAQYIYYNNQLFNKRLNSSSISKG